MPIQRLVNGIHHFQREVFRPASEFFESLAHGQKPEVLFITCADSRINPNLVTQTDPGELFIVRNVGNLVPRYEPGSSEAAAIEFALRQLPIHDVIVCGHSHCGAMQALEGLEDGSAPALEAWLSQAQGTRELIAANYAHLEGHERHMATVKENVLLQLENLRTHPAVHEKLEAGTLHLHAWVYHIEDGLVAAYDPISGQFRPVGEAKD
ncbi:MAG TPA: carbonic anhydrase [Holophagaceae bacterium]|nr:carbonic anhydrase [Holophagaceae bacterium]